MSSVEEDVRKIMNLAPFADPFLETFDPATDSLEAIRGAIDGLEAGIFAYGITSGPQEVEIDDKADFEVVVLNPGGDIVPAGSITPGTYYISRIRDGTKTAIYNHAAVAVDGKVTLDIPYEFTVANWSPGDLIEVKFTGIETDIGGTVTKFPDMVLQGRVVRDEEIYTDTQALLADVGDGSTLTLGSVTGALGDPATDTFAAVIGQLLDAALGMDTASTGAETQVTLLRSILERIGETPADPDDSLHTIVGQRDTAALGKNADDTGAETVIALLRSLIDRIGNVGASDIDGLIDTLTADITGATGIFHEQVDTAVNITAILASETTVLDLSVADTRYIVRSLRLKAADPSTETITVRLYELINDVLTVVDTFDIDGANFGTYHSLMDMFGLQHLAGDSLKVTVQVSGGAGVAVTGQYSHAKTNV